MGRTGDSDIHVDKDTATERHKKLAAGGLKKKGITKIHGGGEMMFYFIDKI